MKIDEKKVIIFGDYHFGIKNSNILFQEYIINSWEYMITHARAHGIKTLIGAGDLFDNRNSLSHKTINIVQSLFAKASDLEFILICGNHDSHFRKTNDVNSPKLILGHLENVKVFDKDIHTLKINNTHIDLIPWLNEENYENNIAEIKTKKDENHIAIGHLEIIGFELVRGVIEKNGLSPKIFKNYSTVFSGHYHLKSRKTNINYIGSSIQTTWNDFNDSKGFIEYDTIDNSFKFEECPFSSIHQKLLISETTPKINTKAGAEFINVDKLKNKILKIYINRKISAAENKIIESICSDSTSYEIIDNTMILNAIENNGIDISDNLEILEDYINEQEQIEKQEALDIIEILTKTYNEVLLTEAEK